MKKFSSLRCPASLLLPVKFPNCFSNMKKFPRHSIDDCYYYQELIFFSLSWSVVLPVLWCSKTRPQLQSIHPVLTFYNGPIPNKSFFEVGGDVKKEKRRETWTEGMKKKKKMKKKNCCCKSPSQPAAHLVYIDEGFVLWRTCVDIQQYFCTFNKRLSILFNHLWLGVFIWYGHPVWNQTLHLL